MPVRSIVGKLRVVLAALSCTVFCATVSAQEPSPVDGVDGVDGTEAREAKVQPGTEEWLDEARDSPGTIGGGPQLVGSYYYTSPLKKFGTDMFVGVYALNALVSIAYLAVVYPLQKLFGSTSLDPVMLWMLVPIAGPFFAQYVDSAKDKPVLRAILIGDSALQAAGVVVGLIGLALSGRRQLRPEAEGDVQLNLGAQGAGLAGVTLSIRTL